MIFQGEKISKLGKNVFVKVPVVNSKGKFMGKVINTLNKKKIKLNITAVYSAKQTRQILKNIDKKTKGFHELGSFVHHVPKTTISLECKHDFVFRNGILDHVGNNFLKG